MQMRHLTDILILEQICGRIERIFKIEKLKKYFVEKNIGYFSGNGFRGDTRI